MVARPNLTDESNHEKTNKNALILKGAIMDILSAIGECLGIFLLCCLFIGWVSANLRVVAWLFNPPSQRPTRLRFGFGCFCIFWVTALSLLCFFILHALRFLPFGLENLLCGAGALIVSIYVGHLSVLIESKVAANASFNYWVLLDDHAREQQRAVIEINFRENSQESYRFDRRLGWDEEHLRLKFLLRKIDAYNRLPSDGQHRVRAELKKYNDLNNNPVSTVAAHKYKIFNAKF